MNDKQLLTLAAKAAGYEWEYEDTGALFVFVPQAHEWNPLTDDGDALRLANKLKIDLRFEDEGVISIWIDESISETYWLRENYNNKETQLNSTRRAIVRAAAEIGKGMK